MEVQISTEWTFVTKTILRIDHSLVDKLRWLVVWNRIVDDSDSKPSKFDRQLRYGSDSKTTIESMITISIKFWFLFDWSRWISNCFWLKDQKRLLECRLKDQKSRFILQKPNLIEKVNLSDLFSIFYRSLLIKFELFD